MRRGEGGWLGYKVARYHCKVMMYFQATLLVGGFVLLRCVIKMYQVE